MEIGTGREGGESCQLTAMATSHAYVILTQPQRRRISLLDFKAGIVAGEAVGLPSATRFLGSGLGMTVLEEPGYS